MALGGGGNGKTSPNAVKAGETFVEATLDDSKFRATLASLGKRVQSVGNTLRNVGIGATAIGTASLLPAIKAVQDLNDLARQGSIAEAFGLTSEQFTGIAGVAKSVGEPTREFIESMVTLGKVASEGALGKGEVAASFFETLNLNAKEFVKLRADEKFYQFFEAVQKVADPLSKVRTLMVAFGEDGGKFLLPLLSKTPEQIRAMGKGFAVSTEDMKKAQDAQASYIDATTGLATAWRAVVVAVAPTVKEIAGIIALIAKPLTEFIKENGKVVAIIGTLAVALIPLGIAFAATGIAISGFIVVLGLVKAAILAVVAVITSPLILAFAGIGTAIAGLTYGFLEFTEAGQTVKSEMASAWSSISETFHTAYDGIVAAIAKGDFSLAWKIAWTGVKIIWNEGLLFLTKQWNKLKAFFIDGADDIWMAIKEGFWNLIAFIMRNVAKAVTFITSNLADLLDAAGLSETAVSVRNVVGRPAEDINAARDEIIKEMRERRAARQAERDASRKKDETEIADRIKELKDELRGLVDKALGKVQNDPLFNSALGTFLDQIMQNRHIWYKGGGEDPVFRGLGRAIRGAFGSRNYQGAFGIGPADKVQKDQLNTQKDILKEMQVLNGKAGPLVFE